MRNFRLSVFVLLLFLGGGCKNAAQESNSTAFKKNDANLAASANQNPEEQTLKKSEKISRQKIANDRRKFLDKVLNKRLFQPSQEVLLKFAQLCERTLQGKPFDVVEMETYNPHDSGAKVNFRTLIFDKRGAVVNKLSITGSVSCDSERGEDDRATVYADLKIKPIPVVKKKAQGGNIDERQLEYTVDEKKLLKMKLNDRKKLLAETLRNGFSQLDAIAIDEFSQVCELETGTNVFYVAGIVYELHNASSDRGLEQVLIFDRENKIVNSFYTDLSPKFCDGNKLYLFNSANALQSDGQEMIFDENGQMFDRLNVKSVKLKELPIYNNLQYKPIEVR